MLAHTLFALIFVFIAIQTQASVAAHVAAPASFSETCVSQIDEIKSQLLIEDVLNYFGGVNALVGQYKMRGFVGALSNTKVEFKIEDNMFWVSVNSDKFKQIHLCREEQGGVSHILKLKVLKPRTPQNGLILVRPGNDKDQLFVSAHKSKWKFLKFKKTHSAPKLTEIVDN